MTLSILIAAALCLIIFLLHRAHLHKGRIEVQATIVKVIRTTHKEKDYYDPDGTYHPPISWTESTPIFAFTHAGKHCQVKGTEWDGLTVGEEKTIFWEPGSERLMLKEGKSVAPLVLLLAADLLTLACALWGRLSGRNRPLCRCRSSAGWTTRWSCSTIPRIFECPKGSRGCAPASP